MREVTKMKKAMLLLLCLILALSLAGCGDAAPQGETEALRFSDSVNMERIEALAGRRVTIMGYMATMSPVSGKYMYLMNMPYQSCPFCVPNTAQLANTMAVYAPEGKTFAYTDRAIRVTGTLAVEDCVDEFGYTYNYRIVNAAYEIVDTSALEGDYALWQQIAADGIITEMNAMFDYLHFICQWPFYQGTYQDESGNSVTFNFYAGDVWQYLQDDGPYGYAEQYAAAYFPSLIARARAISPTELEDLVAIIEQARQTADHALAAFQNGEYTYDEAADQFTLNDSDGLYQQWFDAYLAFSEWMGRWEM